MYCFTYANNINCIVNELILWSDISDEHPIFVQNMARLTNKDLPPELMSALDQLHKNFSDINERAKNLRKTGLRSPYMASIQATELRRLVDQFLMNDRKALTVYKQVSEISKEDMVWQTLIEHIREEQTFMYETFCELLGQTV